MSNARAMSHAGGASCARGNRRSYFTLLLYKRRISLARRREQLEGAEHELRHQVAAGVEVVEGGALRKLDCGRLLEGCGLCGGVLVEVEGARLTGTAPVRCAQRA